MSTYRSRFVPRLVLTGDDNRYADRVRDILLAEPCHGVPPKPAQLLGHIYLGSQANAESLRLLRQLGITHVLNCAGYKGPRKTPHVSPYEGLDIDYYEFQAEDIDTYDITKHFHEAFSYLDKVERKGGIALVHCALGVNRSAATCAAYMIHSKRWPLLKVIQIIKDHRRVVLSNKGFQQQLVKFAKSHGMLGNLEESTKKSYRDYTDYGSYSSPRKRDYSKYSNISLRSRGSSLPREDISLRYRGSSLPREDTSYYSSDRSACSSRDANDILGRYIKSTLSHC